MPDDALIVLTGDKGGVGKSTIAVLVTEWLISIGVKVKLIDADPNQTIQTWVDKCHELGYQVNYPDASVTVIDTPGTVGSSLNKYILRAEIILIPFQPHVADLEVVVGWFLSVKESLQSRVVFVPNRLSRTIEQRDGMKELEAVIAEEGRGTLINGLSNRPAVYPPLLNGRSENFFNSSQSKKILMDTQPLFREISNRLKGLEQ
ncbi:ParA family protein [bacterium]|nr:ParA family protein [bacterium]